MNIYNPDQLDGNLILSILSSFSETSTSEKVSGEQKEENITPSQMILMDTSPIKSASKQTTSILHSTEEEDIIEISPKGTQDRNKRA